jgi:sugar lactone lactonase YvrE
VPVCLAVLGIVGWLLWHSESQKTAKAPPAPAPAKTLPAPVAPPAPTANADLFQVPWGVAVDGAANVYVADSEAGTISKISPAGQVTILAGRAGVRGPGNGLGANARFIIPRGVALDQAGNLYVTDAYTIRKVTPAGEVTTLAGKPGYPATPDGPGSEARFSWPSAVAVDGAGDILVGDRYAIRKIAPAGQVTTLAGSANRAGSIDGTGSNARFSDNEKGIAVDGGGNIYVADTLNHMIRRITPAGAVTRFAGSLRQGSADGSGTNASFASPCGLAIAPDGMLYVADTGNHTIRKVTPAGVVSTLAGTAGTAGSTDGPCSRALFNQPRGIALDSAGNIIVADAGNRAIRKITPAGIVATLAGRPSPLALNR